MIHNHWTEHLPEAGTIADWGRKQTYRLMRIADLQKQIRVVRAELADEERRLEAMALSGGWTAEEIEVAQATAREYPSRQAYRDAMRETRNP